MSDHWHYASDIHGAAEEHHRHYDEESKVAGLREDLGRAEARIRDLEDDLRDALERIRTLEDRQPDYADPEAADEDPDACKCGHLAADHTPGAPFPCSRCDCDEFAAAVMPAPEPGSNAAPAPEPRLRRIRRSPADEPFGDLDREDGDYDDCEPTL